MLQVIIILQNKNALAPPLPQNKNTQQQQKKNIKNRGTDSEHILTLRLYNNCFKSTIKGEKLRTCAHCSIFCFYFCFSECESKDNFFFADKIGRQMRVSIKGYSTIRFQALREACLKIFYFFPLSSNCSCVLSFCELDRALYLWVSVHYKEQHTKQCA